MNTRVSLSGIHVYPVKSCAGVSVTEARLTTRGLEHDREWMVVRGDGRFVTQREAPRMALIRATPMDGGLRLDSPGKEVCDVHLPPGEGAPTPVTIWKDQLTARDAGGAAAAWLSDALNVEVRLVRFDPAVRRLSSKEWTGDSEAENRFSDGFPLLVLSEESLSDLNTRISGPALAMKRFRPNLVIRGGGPYLEDAITEMVWGALRIRLVKPCMRCSITTIDPTTGGVGLEPLPTLARYRRDAALGGVTFGQNAILLSGAGETLRLGTSFDVTYREKP